MTGIEKARKGMIAVAVVMLESVARRLMGTRGRSSGMMALVVAGMVLLVAAGGASAATAITGCQEITEPGEYYLANDITNATMDTTQYACIDIQADDVILDGMGHLIDGVTATTGRSGIRAMRINVPGHSITIHNVEITNFDSGISILGWGSGKFTDIVIENCVIHDNGAGGGQGIHLEHVCDSTISRNDVSNQAGTGDSCESGGNGIFLLGDAGHYDCARNNIISYNNAHGNVKAGIFTKACPDYNTISYNNCGGNGEAGHGATGGIVMRCKKCDFNDIAHNDVSNNFGDGIYCRGNSNTFESNTAVGNSDNGIDIGDTPGGGDGGDNNGLYHNTACDNGGADICTCGGADTSGCYGNHGDDNTCDTTSNYDDDGSTGCTFSCSPPEKPDLAITDKSETLTGSTLEVTYTVANNGGESAGASTTGIYAGSAQIATDSVEALAAGVSYTSTVTIDPFDCPCGTTVTIKVCADKDGAVDESDEANNCREKEFDCPLGAVDPKLCADPEHNFGTVRKGQTRTWTFDITNCGGEGTLNWTVTDDQLWITVSPADGKDAGTVTVTIDTASLTPGTHTGTVTVASDHGTETGTITVNVQGSQPPPPPADVPTFTPIGMFALVGLLGIAGIGAIRRK